MLIENPLSPNLEFGYISAFYWEHPLENPLFFESGKLVKVEAELREHHFCKNPENGSDASMSGMNTFLMTAYGRSPADRILEITCVSEDVSYTNWVTTYSPFHGGVEFFGFSTEISPVPINHFALFLQVDLWIVCWSSCNIECPNQTEVTILFGVEFVSEIGFNTLFRPCTVITSPGLCVIAHYQTVVWSGIFSGKSRNFMNDIRSLACRSSSGLERLYIDWKTSNLTMRTISIFGRPPCSVVLV